MTAFDTISDDLARMAALDTARSDPDLMQTLLVNLQGGTLAPLTTDRDVGSDEFVDADMRPGPNGQSYSRNMAIVPRVWKSAPDHEPAALIYATEREIDILRKADIYGSNITERMHYGPQHVPSLQGDGFGGGMTDSGFGGGMTDSDTFDNSAAAMGGWANQQQGAARPGNAAHEADADTAGNRSLFDALGTTNRSLADRVADFLASFFGFSRVATFDEVENKFNPSYEFDARNVPALGLTLTALNPVLGAGYAMQRYASQGRPVSAALAPLSLLSPFAAVTNSFMGVANFNVDKALGTQTAVRPNFATATEDQTSPYGPISRDDTTAPGSIYDGGTMSALSEGAFHQAPTATPGASQLLSPELSSSTPPSSRPSIVYGVSGGPVAQSPVEPGAFNNTPARFGSYRSSRYGGFG